jgi:hypothetical protein
MQTFHINNFWKLTCCDYGTLKNKKIVMKQKLNEKEQRKLTWYCKRKNTNDFESRTLNSISSLQMRKIEHQHKQFPKLAHTPKKE